MASSLIGSDSAYFQILAEEQAGLAHVTKILQKDLKDLGVIEGVPVKQEERDGFSESVSALRRSVLP